MDHDGTTTSQPANPPEGAPSFDERSGISIGPYRLLELIGEGGFGEVWLAEQREPIARRVALKLVKPGMDSRAVIARFEQERQALAVMDHPHIAKVLDAGTTPAGRLFFVMEFVKGSPITEYCDRERLTISQRLSLFMNVCDAVQHAHMKGIVHRDLKPSNILVAVGSGSDDDHVGRPRPVVIDFGVAKAVALRLTEKTIYTERGQLIGTPEYMSPEQAEMAETDIDTRTDVYALGVILYQLLTGVLPFDPKTLRSAGYAAIQKIIREQDPPRPSTKLTSLGADAAKIAESRRVALRDLAADLKHELEWIPLKAMRKERAERYRTAAELSDDIANYLASRPLIAGPESAAYRLRKFVRRNRAGVLAGAAVLLALVLGLAGTAWQYREARRQRDEARRERDAAEQSRRESELIARFMSDTLEGAGPGVARGRDITLLKEMMDGAAARIEQGDLKAAPAAELRLRGTIGDTYKDLALYSESQKLLEPAVALARARNRGDSLEVIGALTRLGQLRQAKGDLEAAEPLFREALQMHRRLVPGDDTDVAGELSDLAVLLQMRGDLAGAEPLCREALDMWRRLFPGDHQDVAGGLTNLAFVLEARGDYAGALPLAREALLMRQRMFPGDHPEVADGLNNLGWLLRGRGDLAGAEPMLRDALAMVRRLYPADHPLVIKGLNNLGRLLQARGDFAEAETLFRAALEARRLTLGETHSATLVSYFRLAGLLIQAGRYADAEPLVRASVEGHFALYGSGHIETRDAVAQAVTLYELWDAREVGKGYDAKAAEWKVKLDALAAPAPEAARAEKK